MSAKWECLHLIGFGLPTRVRLRDVQVLLEIFAPYIEITVNYPSGLAFSELQDSVHDLAETKSCLKLNSLHELRYMQIVKD